MSDIFIFFYFYYLEFSDSLNSTYFVNDQKSNNCIFKEILFKYHIHTINYLFTSDLNKINLLHKDK
jgi:hypothetical protein